MIVQLKNVKSIDVPSVVSFRQKVYGRNSQDEMVCVFPETIFLILHSRLTMELDSVFYAWRIAGLYEGQFVFNIGVFYQDWILIFE